VKDLTGFIEMLVALKNRNAQGLTEQRKLDTYSGYNDRGLPPVNTQIRNFVPDPGKIGDFRFMLNKDEIRNFWEWRKKNPSIEM
jgi:hypothetical protein